jgi:hypothetical protein
MPMVPMMRPVRTENELRLLEAAKAVLAEWITCVSEIDSEPLRRAVWSLGLAVEQADPDSPSTDYWAQRLAVAQATGDEEIK